MSENIPKPAKDYLDYLAQEVFESMKEKRPMDEDLLKSEFDRLSPADQQIVRNEYYKASGGKHFKY